MGKIVFLDTNVFVGNNFSFLNKPLTKLKIISVKVMARRSLL